MAKFLDTRGAVSEISKLIKSTSKTLILVTPYLKLSADFKELLAFRNSERRPTTIIYGKQELNPQEKTFLQGMDLVTLKYYENLHAKCYFNDRSIIITSLNLHEFSMANNKEMGVLIDRNDPSDVPLAKDALKEVHLIERFSKVIGSPRAVPIPSHRKIGTKPPSPTKSPRRITKPMGYCIRTGAPIPFNVAKPLSPDAYRKWSEYGNPDYPEKFCHFSGDPAHGEVSVSRPILRKHWKTAKERFDL